MSALFQDKRTGIAVEALKLSKEADIDSFRRILLMTCFFSGLWIKQPIRGAAM